MGNEGKAPDTWLDGSAKSSWTRPSPADPNSKLVDLHALIIREGLERVAESAGVTEGALRNMRSCYRPTRLVNLHQIKKDFPDFDIDGTVMRLGPRRVERMNGKTELESGGEGQGKESGTGSG